MLQVTQPNPGIDVLRVLFQIRLQSIFGLAVFIFLGNVLFGRIIEHLDECFLLLFQFGLRPVSDVLFIKAEPETADGDCGTDDGLQTAESAKQRNISLAMRTTPGVIVDILTTETTRFHFYPSLGAFKSGGILGGTTKSNNRGFHRLKIRETFPTL